MKKSKGGFFSKKRSKGTAATSVASDWLNTMQEFLLTNVKKKKKKRKK